MYLLGNQECLSKQKIAVVGTRMMSPYGEEMTHLFVRKLVEEGFCIVSGLARGVDKVAHETCLEFGGYTIAVLAHGLDYCYPKEHVVLKERILQQGGLLVSQYPEGVGPTVDKFRARDGLMAHLSDAILAVEAPRRSGVKITVSAAADEGRPVYVVPGPINQISYHGSVEIIRNGGIPVYSPSDLMKAMRYTT